METIQKIVGIKFVKLSVVFKRPFDKIPRVIAKTKKIYPDTMFIKSS